MTRPVTCGVLVTDGTRVVLGHATRTTRWDIPKGLAEPGEPHAVAARRELREETGLDAPDAALLPLGLHRYLPAKDLALFAWQLTPLPAADSLHCTSLVGTGTGAFPEFDRFAVLPWADAMGRLGRSMAAVLAAVLPQQGWQ